MNYRIFGPAAAAAVLGLGSLLPAQEVVKDSHVEVHLATGSAAGGVTGMAAFAPQASTFQFIAAEPGLFGKTVTGAPYSGEGFTEMVRTLADGGRITNKHSKKVWRDGQGRTREETTLPMLGPWAAQGGTAPKLITIIDPVSKTIYTLNEKDKTAARRKMPELHAMLSGTAVGGAVMGTKVRTAAPNVVWQTQEKELVTVTDGVRADVTMPRLAEPAPGGNVAFARSTFIAVGDGAKEEALGTQILEGIKVEGKRMTHTIKAGEIGNDRELVSVTERWTSPELQILIRMTSKDPQMGETTYKLTNISRAEPSPSLFQVPADYTISDAQESIRIERKIEAK